MRTFKRNALAAIMGALIALIVAVPVMQVHAQTQTIGPYGFLGFNTGNTAIDTAALAAGQMVGLLTGTPTAAASYTTPTATALCAAFPFVGASANPYGWDLFIKNTSAGANTITMVGGSGVTLSGTGTIAQNHARQFKVVLTECRAGSTAAATLFSLVDSVF